MTKLKLDELQTPFLRNTLRCNLEGEALGASLFSRGYAIDQSADFTECKLKYAKAESRKEKRLLTSFCFRFFTEIAFYIILYVNFINAESAKYYHNAELFLFLTFLTVTALHMFVGLLKNPKDKYFFIPLGFGSIYGNPTETFKYTLMLANHKDASEEHKELCSYLAQHEQVMDFVHDNYTNLKTPEKMFADKLIETCMNEKDKQAMLSAMRVLCDTKPKPEPKQLKSIDVQWRQDEE